MTSINTIVTQFKKSHIFNGYVVVTLDGKSFLMDQDLGHPVWLSDTERVADYQDCPILTALIPDDCGGWDFEQVLAIRNAECGNPYESSDFQYVQSGKPYMAIRPSGRAV